MATWPKQNGYILELREEESLTFSIDYRGIMDTEEEGRAQFHKYITTTDYKEVRLVRITVDPTTQAILPLEVICYLCKK